MRFRTAFATFALASCIAPALAGVAGPGQVHCDDSFTVFSAGYVACSGVSTGDPGATVSFAGHGSFSLAGSTGDGSGAFSADPGAVTFGALTLGVPAGGSFVVALHGGGNHSLYLFDGSAVTVDFDTYGVADGFGGAGPNLTRASLYITAVPEPATVALLLAGLSGVGFATRRRRAG